MRVFIFRCNRPCPLSISDIGVDVLDVKRLNVKVCFYNYRLLHKEWRVFVHPFYKVFIEVKLDDTICIFVIR